VVYTLSRDVKDTTESFALQGPLVWHLRILIPRDAFVKKPQLYTAAEN
jgi:hypothetical protein